jgi:hypothetical protein
MHAMIPNDHLAPSLVPCLHTQLRLVLVLCKLIAQLLIVE